MENIQKRISRNQDAFSPLVETIQVLALRTV